MILPKRRSEDARSALPVTTFGYSFVCGVFRSLGLAAYSEHEAAHSGAVVSDRVGAQPRLHDGPFEADDSSMVKMIGRLPCTWMDPSPD
jgi:hypothetical protein